MKDKKWPTCHQCGKPLTISYPLGVERWECIPCGNAFWTPGELREAIESYTPERIIECPGCGGMMYVVIDQEYEVECCVRCEANKIIYRGE